MDKVEADDTQAEPSALWDAAVTGIFKSPFVMEEHDEEYTESLIRHKKNYPHYGQPQLLTLGSIRLTLRLPTLNQGVCHCSLWRLMQM